jgi:hypothetical protein
LRKVTAVGKESDMGKLDRERVRELLREADDKWYLQHSGKYEYQGHLDFVADYIARNYHKPRKKLKQPRLKLKER